MAPRIRENSLNERKNEKKLEIRPIVFFFYYVLNLAWRHRTANGAVGVSWFVYVAASVHNI